LPKILTHAANFFTQQGYAKASMEEIIARTQFNRRAFYIEFKSKQGFLHAVLQHYIAHQLSACQQSLIARSDSVKKAIYNYFSAYHRLISKPGCLLVNCISELGRNDETVQYIAQHYYDALQLRCSLPALLKVLLFRASFKAAKTTSLLPCVNLCRV
jgi:TetR/AcrR family transcriptional repressor of nem operon